MSAIRPIAIVAEEVLLKIGHPMHYKTLTSLLLDQCNLRGKTPALSVRSCLARNSKFKRVEEGIYALSEWKEYPTVKFAKDIAFDILEKKGNPIDVISLGNQILKQRQFKGGAKTVVRAFLNDKRFYYFKSTGLIGLSKWKK